MFRAAGLIILLVLLCTFASVAQNTIKISGKVISDKGKPLSGVSVMLVGLAGKTLTDDRGSYQLESRLKNFSISYKLQDYKTTVIKFNANKGDEIIKDVVLYTQVKELKTIDIVHKNNSLGNAKNINIKDISSMPSVSMNFESILKTLPGVSTNNELSAQYNVRGGNFDENLIYVNDIEINRPILIRNGQQEGLSFINPELVSKATFSAGGFSAKYDDKLSSVLDVRYNRPDSNQFLITTGLMGYSASAKIKTKNYYLLFGYRHKNNKNILSTQDQLGSYQPRFNDVQAIYQYDFSEKFNINILGNLNTGRFQLIPESRHTLFGTLDKPMQLKIDYDGQEIDDYVSYGGAITTAFHPNSKLSIKWINSYFSFIERERFDIDGNYIFEEIDDSQKDSGFGVIKKNRGLGNYYSYARNKLNTDQLQSSMRVQLVSGKHDFNVGVKFEKLKYIDDLKEYSYIDSAGYILPMNQNSFTFQNSVFANNKLEVENFSGFAQDNINLSSKVDLQLGFRLTYSGLSKEVLFSPRALLSYQPDSNHIWRFTAGVYHQLPSYRSIRNKSGNLFNNQKSQISYNTSLAYDISFIGLGTNMKFTSEIYYKYSPLIIPYTIDNVRINYLPNQIYRGHIYGADFSLGGELVNDLMSNFRVSFLKANQKRTYNGIVPLGGLIDNKYYKRPTDQRLNLSVFFQDKLFRSPTYKVHLNLLYGSRLPIGSPYAIGYNDNFEIPSYRRVDIGFSTDFLDEKVQTKPVFLSRYFSSVIAYAEIFNLFNINNTVSYLWLKDVDNVSYAIPNYLTMRQLNFKLIFKIK